jgi:phosphoribosylformylglycinamidine synthase
MAITDNMNFGNPERPEIMGQFVGCIKGIGEACIALDYPVVSGNVSLYNETNGTGILPTPTIGGVGLMADVNKRASIAFGEEGQNIIVIGETIGHLGQSLYLREIEGREEGTPPPVDLAVERLNGDFVRDLIESGRITTCHDISGGGLGIALAEMAMASDIGCTIDVPEDAPALHGWLFGEDQARYIITTGGADAILAEAKAQGVRAEKIGQTGGKQLTVGTQATISLKELSDGHQNWLPDYMAQS